MKIDMRSMCVYVTTANETPNNASQVYRTLIYSVKHRNEVPHFIMKKIK